MKFKSERLALVVLLIILISFLYRNKTDKDQFNNLNRKVETIFSVESSRRDSIVDLESIITSYDVELKLLNDSLDKKDLANENISSKARKEIHFLKDQLAETRERLRILIDQRDSINSTHKEELAEVYRKLNRLQAERDSISRAAKHLVCEKADAVAVVYVSINTEWSSNAYFKVKKHTTRLPISITTELRFSRQYRALRKIANDSHLSLEHLYNYCRAQNIPVKSVTKYQLREAIRYNLKKDFIFDSFVFGVSARDAREAYAIITKNL